MEGLIIVALLALLAVWLLRWGARTLGTAVSPKAYMTLAVVVVLGILLLYAGTR